MPLESLSKGNNKDAGPHRYSGLGLLGIRPVAAGERREGAAAREPFSQRGPEQGLHNHRQSRRWERSSPI